jgi:hypothetical protein
VTATAIDTRRCAQIEPGSLTSAAAAGSLLDRFPAYGAGLDWVRRFVLRPHPDLGRTGAVCPRLGAALRADLVWLVTIRTGRTTPVHAAGVGELLAATFHQQVGDDSARVRAGAVLAFFPDVPAELAGDFIDGGHRLLRRWFVAAGLMLGEFHPDSGVGSVHNPALPVMRSPDPMFAVRALSRHDLLFLDTEQTPPAQRLDYLHLYRRRLAPHLAPAELADLDARIAALLDDASTSPSLPARNLDGAGSLVGGERVR